MRGVVEQQIDDTVAIKTFYGSSNDDKPTAGVADGSVFIETDTQYVYMFDEENETWRQLA